MIKKILPVICLLTLLGCEPNNSGDPTYTFSDTVQVKSISEPINNDGQVAQIVTGVSSNATDGYIVIITDGVHLQRLNADKTGYMNIPVDQYKIITPGDSISIAWTQDQIDYAPRPPIVRADTVVILK